MFDTINADTVQDFIEDEHGGKKMRVGSGTIIKSVVQNRYLNVNTRVMIKF